MTVLSLEMRVSSLTRSPAFRKEKTTTKTLPNPRPLKRNEKMNYLRNRMTMVRKKKEADEKLTSARLHKTGLRRSTTLRGAKIMEANMKTMEDIQDKKDVVIVGSDVCALSQ